MTLKHPNLWINTISTEFPCQKILQMWAFPLKSSEFRELKYITVAPGAGGETPGKQPLSKETRKKPQESTESYKKTRNHRGPGETAGHAQKGLETSEK